MTVPEHERIPESALDWHRAGNGAALATVVETWGSAARARSAMPGCHAICATIPLDLLIAD